MEFFRWFLILAGVALLAATFFLGRRKVDSVSYRRQLADEAFDPSLEDLSVPISGRPSEAPSFNADDFDGEFLSDAEIDSVLPERETDHDSISIGMDFDDAADDLGEQPDNVGAKRSRMDSVKSLANAVKAASLRSTGNAEVGAVADEASMDFAEFDSYEDPGLAFEEKLITVHVMAPRDLSFRGSDLKTSFEQHGYEYGDLSIYHCSYEDEKVFSVANMIKPGSFDPENMHSFKTPGIMLFMNLPVTLDADVAFDFLIREATELAEELGGQVRDAERSTLSKQTIQHMTCVKKFSSTCLSRKRQPAPPYSKRRQPE